MLGIATAEEIGRRDGSRPDAAIEETVPVASSTNAAWNGSRSKDEAGVPTGTVPAQKVPLLLEVSPLRPHTLATTRATTARAVSETREEALTSVSGTLEASPSPAINEALDEVGVDLTRGSWALPPSWRPSA